MRRQRRVCVSTVVGFHAAQTNERDCGKSSVGHKKLQVQYAYLCMCIYIYIHTLINTEGIVVARFVWIDKRKNQALKVIEFGERNPDIECKVSTK